MHSPLFLRDAADVVGDMRRANQGAFRFDAARSGFYPARMKGFPDNTEIETIVTFAGDAPGRLVTNVTPNPMSFTMRIHHSLLRAPTGYTPRRADPRIGVSSVNFRDYAQPINESTEVEWVTRWRLEKQNPAAAMSEPKKPIVFYLDAAIPEPIRGAMREGALAWNKAFEAAGFRNAVQVKDPTPDMDPMDIRYAWILWINRDERGFSSGGTYRDPRTGEILGSKTRMDSHRIRTIGNYFESYTPTTGTRGDDAGFDECGMVLPVPEEVLALASQAGANMPEAQRELALRRQSLLTTHELGHVMGFGHNFASSINDRASAMEYPTPRVKVTQGRLDLSEAFELSTGAYDAFMTRYAYTELPPDKEAAGLNAIIAEMRARNILYVPSTDPRWVWYDDRATPTENLRETMAARKVMLAQYGPDILKPGEPIGALRDIRLVDDLPPPPLGDRVGGRLRRRHVPQHRRQGRDPAAHRNRAGGAAARGARAAVGRNRAGQHGHSRDAPRPAHAQPRAPTSRICPTATRSITCARPAFSRPWWWSRSWRRPGRRGWSPSRIGRLARCRCLRSWTRSRRTRGERRATPIHACDRSGASANVWRSTR